MPFYIKQNDTGPSLSAILKDENNVPVLLTGATVRFHMRAVDSDQVKVDAVATIVNASSGSVRYDWVEADTDTPGAHFAEFEVTYPDGTVETFPNDGYTAVQIVADIA